MNSWNPQQSRRREHPEVVLLDQDGALMQGTFDRLFAPRDDRPVRLAE